MNLQCCVHDSLENMLIMVTLFVMTAVMMADATPACSYYCALYFSSKPPRPVECDCRTLQEQDSLVKRFKRQAQANQSTFTPQPKRKLYDIQRTFTIENESLNINANDEEDSKGDPNKINDSKNMIQIDTMRKCVIVHSILMSGRKLTTTKFKANLKTDEINNYKHLTDSEIMEILNKECNGVGSNSDWNMNNDSTLNGIITNNINLKEDNFSVISESIKLFKDMDSSFFKYKRTSRTQLQWSAPKEILSTESSTKSRTMLSATENTTAITVLSDEVIHTTPPPKKHPTAILTAKNFTEKIYLTQNITSIVENKNILETSTLNPHLNPNTSANDNTELNDTNLLDRSGNLDGQITESMLGPVKHQTSKGLSKGHNESTKRINETQYSTSTTRNNITLKSLPDTHETAKITTPTINQTKGIENEFRAISNTPKSNYLNSDSNDGTVFRKHYNDRQYYNESEIPIVRIVSREYPNDTVSSIVNGTEILPNDDFRDEEFKSTSAKNNRITVPTAGSPYPNASQSKFKHSMQDNVEKSSAKYIINGKLDFKCKRKPIGPLKISLEISTVCDQMDKQNKSQSILLSILCSCMQLKNVPIKCNK